MKYIHEFQNNTEFENYYFGQNYIEPHVSLTVDVNRLDYNKSGKALLRSMPLTFDVLTDGTITLNNGGSVGIYVKYKLNDGDWTQVTTPCTINVVSGDAVQFKKSIGSIGNSSQYHYFGGTATFNVKGNIMSLFNSGSDDFGSITSLDNSYTRTFYRLFYNCTGLIDASELILPATTLTDYCYSQMFRNCTSLTAAPSVLPATTLSDNCYNAMFSGCTNLTSAPELPATTLKGSCYQSMFYGCGSLTSAPALPATTLANKCYSSMFASCSSITTAPELPATTLANNCYSSMFASCSSITTAPELPATTLVDTCYASMFNSCFRLTSVPSLPATTLANNCYSQMFRNCTSLTAAPALPATTLANNCYSAMFSGCTNLTAAPSVLPATTLANGCYSAMFSGCSNITTAPELPATTLVDSCYPSMFDGCSNLNYVRCLATDISASNALYLWLNKVSSTGTFYKAAGVTYPSGVSGIPSGWTVQDATN